jgi:beta-N-acetylhexosaminidase
MYLRHFQYTSSSAAIGYFRLKQIALFIENRYDSLLHGIIPGVKMNLRKKIAQMLIMGFSGQEIDRNSPVSQWIKEAGIGGVLLFDYDIARKQYGKNLKTRQQIQELNAELRHFSNFNDQLPLFIALDYEGGAVDRLKHIPGCMATKSAAELGALSDNELYSEAEKMALTLKQLGFNLNFAPVVDVNLNDASGIIGKLGRSFSSNSQRVTHVASLFAKAFSHCGIITSYKHFPGHGSASGDTHDGFVDVSDSFQECELEPYQVLVSNHSPAMVMTAHVINRKLDDSGLPATLSHTMLTGLLREQLGFKGVIISDDLQMKAISQHFSLTDALRLTLNAGADMLIFANQLGSISPFEVIDQIEQLVISGAVSEARILEAYQRVVYLKQQMLNLSTAEGVQPEKHYESAKIHVKM